MNKIDINDVVEFIQGVNRDYKNWHIVKAMKTVTNARQKPHVVY